jgi:hypothetical protein
MTYDKTISTIEKFSKNTINNKSILYERLDGFDEKNKQEELLDILEYFNIYHNYDSKFKKEDFEAIVPDRMIKINEERWFPIYDYINKPIPYKKETNEEKYYNCGCSQKCGALYLVRNKITNIYFGVGSICIQKFIDNDFINKVNNLKNISLKKCCDKCKEPIHLKTSKNNKSNWCIQNKLPNITLCNKCIKNIIVLLDIKYKEKDEFRKYGTLWSIENKTWYVKGKVPKQLYDRIKYIDW